MTKEEKALKLLMQLSAITYTIVGFGFALFPETVLYSLNLLSQTLTPTLPEMPISVEKFWLSLAFSMMMTIAALCFIAKHNIRKNKNYVLPVLIAKIASSICSLCYFIFSARCLAYLAIFLIDGAIFWITLFFYLRANNAFFRSQTAFLRQNHLVPKSTGPTKVVSLKGEDKFEVLDRVLAESDFYEILEKRLKESRKSLEDFSIVIKPNFMFMHSKKDFSSYTDPELVEHLINRIAALGFTNIAIVEAQSTYGNYYKNREVLKVAEYIGYSTKKNYKIVDLTKEKVPYDYGSRFGKHFVGPTWRDADFRISFAKNKTHIFCHYTLALKNIYGTLPMQNKLKEYHVKREYDWPTIETLKDFPVHFGLIDAIYSADGQLGVITDPIPNHTKTIIGGENLIAVDWVGAFKMSLDPDDPKIGRFLPLAVESFGKPEIIWLGDKSVYQPWQNVSDIFVQSLDLIEESYAFSNWWFAGLSAMDKYFAFKKRAWPILFFRRILAPFKRVFFRFDHI